MKVIPSFPDYGATEDGQIIRLTKGHGVSPGKVLKQFSNTRTGHLRVKLAGNRAVMVHRLVCEAYHGPPPPDRPLALHRDDDPTNNHWRNLRWGSHQDNADDCELNGGKCLGEDRTDAVIDRETARRVKDLLPRMSQRKVAAELGIKRGVVQRIAQGQTWRGA